MGILVKGRKLPVTCNGCLVSQWDEDLYQLYCGLYDDSDEPEENTVDTHARENTKPDYCPLIYIPDEDE